jgi:ubiquinone/menaquinone biosynthesis C-methylase UbiE
MERKGAGHAPGLEPAYVFGHSGKELERLAAQARLIDPITRQFFVEAGIAPGMRVLDIGSGAGDVAFLAADLVGPSGDVIGTDRASSALATARARAEALSLQNVFFREGDPSELRFERSFDAIVGRYVLVFSPDPTAMIRSLACNLRPGGIMVFHEVDRDGSCSLPPLPTYDRCEHWITETLRLMGNEPRIGLKLYSSFVAAGLPAPSMRLQAVIGGGADSSARLHFVADQVASLLPEMERLGVASADEVDIETLVDRLTRELVAGGGVTVGRSEIGVWARMP